MKSKNYIAVILTIFTAAALSFSPAYSPGYKIGDKAEDFSLKSTDGKMVSLKNFKNVKGFIVIFTCNHCPYAKGYEQRIIALHKKFEPEGYPVVAIQPNNPAVFEEDSYENMQKRAKEKNYPFVYLIDEEQKIYPRFGATKTPHVFILNADLEVQYIGTIDDNPQNAASVKTRYVENAIAALSQGKKPDPAETRAIGCGIR